MNEKTNAHSIAPSQKNSRADTLVEEFQKQMALYLSWELSKNISHAKRENASNCRFNGSSVPYGYQIDDEKHYQINSDQAPVVLEIFQRFAAGVLMAELLKDLDAKGIRNAKGNPYTRKTLTKLLTNRIYIGEYHYADIVVPGGVPAIVDKELFDAVAVRLADLDCR